MGFWQDASPAIKGTIVAGAVAVAYFLIAMMTGLPPYGSQVGDEVQQTRGIQH